MPCPKNKQKKWLWHFYIRFPLRHRQRRQVGCMTDTELQGEDGILNTTACLRICNSIVSTAWPPVVAAPSAVCFLLGCSERHVSTSLCIPEHRALVLERHLKARGWPIQPAIQPTSFSPWALPDNAQAEIPLLLSGVAVTHSHQKNSLYRIFRPLLNWVPLDSLDLPS